MGEDSAIHFVSQSGTHGGYWTTGLHCPVVLSRAPRVRLAACTGRVAGAYYEVWHIPCAPTGLSVTGLAGALGSANTPHGKLHA